MSEQQVNNLNVLAQDVLISPEDLKQAVPLTEAAERTVIEGRETIQRILDGRDPRLLMVVGPCSIHDPEAALEYASDHRIDAVVQEPHKRKPNIRPGGYAENFSPNRRQTWTH
jgi:phospho-2-dehydro-3-deoxyheptonate aldolase